MSNPRAIEFPPASGPRLAALAAIGLAIMLPWGPARTSARLTAVRLRVDPSLAPRQVLLALPGLGPSRVGKIEDARSSSPFRSLDDLDRRVKGIGPATAASLEPHLRFRLNLP